MASVWDRRIQRAELLSQRLPFAREALEFYARLAAFQARLQDSLRGIALAPPSGGQGRPLQRVSPLQHRELLRPHFQAFLELVGQLGPQELAAAAGSLRGVSPDRWEALWDAYWRDEPLAPWEADHGSAVAFFPKAFLQPYASLLAAGLRGNGGDEPLCGAGVETSGRCPLCGGRPQVSVLREEGYGAARSLLCSRCETEWRYRRVRCVACGEEDSGQLLSFHAPEWPHVRVSACRSCAYYLKEVDLTRDGFAVPVVDEMATLPLDLVAAEEGYQKVEPNLVGA